MAHVTIDLPFRSQAIEFENLTDRRSTALYCAVSLARLEITRRSVPKRLTRQPVVDSAQRKTSMRKLGLTTSLCVALIFAISNVSSSRAQISDDTIKIGVMADMNGPLSTAGGVVQ